MKGQVGTINVAPSWERLWELCRGGEFPAVYEELKNPCILIDQINESLDKGKTIKLYKNEIGKVIMEEE